MAFKQKAGSPFLRNFGIGKSPAKGKVHTHPHPEEKKKESKGTKTNYPLNQFGNIDWSKVPRGEGQGTMKVSPAEMKSPLEHGTSTKKGGHHPMYSGSSTKLKDHKLQPGGDPVHNYDETPSKKEKAPTEMKSPAKHLIGKHPAKDGHVRADHKKNRETKKRRAQNLKEHKKNTVVIDGKTYDKRDHIKKMEAMTGDELMAYTKKSPTEMKSPVKTHTKDADGKPIVHKKNISIKGDIMTNTETGESYNLKTGKTTKGKTTKGLQILRPPKTTKGKRKSPAEMKSPVKDKDKIAKAKSRVQDAKETITAYKEPGEIRKAGTSIYQDQDMGTGETRATKKSERKLKRAEKKISRAEKLYAKGKTKRAERKLKRATKKADKAISIMTKHGSGRTKRTVQDKYKDDPRYQD